MKSLPKNIKMAPMEWTKPKRRPFLMTNMKALKAERQKFFEDKATYKIYLLFIFNYLNISIFSDKLDTSFKTSKQIRSVTK